MANKKELTKNYFTPCRTVGLKRKSIGTPSPITNSPTIHETSVTHVSDDLEIDSAKSVSNIDEVETPKRTCNRSAPLLKNGLGKFRKESSSVEVNRVESSPSSCEQTKCIDIDLEIQKTEERIFKKLKEVKNLQLDTLNAKQHDLEKLHHLTKKWRHACQAVLNELLAEYRARDESCSMMTLLRSLGIPASLVRYNETDMEFHDE